MIFAEGWRIMMLFWTVSKRMVVVCCWTGEKNRKNRKKTPVLPKPYLSTWCRSELVDGSTGKHGEGHFLRTPTRIVLKAGSLL